jgi:LPXTG-motif cell wall-anchored protein
MFRSHLTKFAMPAVASAVLLAPAGLALACSPSPSPVPCSVKIDGVDNTANQSNSAFTISGDEVTGRVIVSGDGKCDVTIVTWQAPNGTNGKPYDSQKLFDHKTESFTVGKHTITTKMPDCYYQVDLVKGDHDASSTGTPAYGSNLMGSLHGGMKACGGKGGGTPTPTPTPSSTPVPTSTPTTTPVVSPSPSPSPAVLSATTLPDTGSATSGIVGLGSMISAGYTYIRARRRMRG